MKKVDLHTFFQNEASGKNMKINFSNQKYVLPFFYIV